MKAMSAENGKETVRGGRREEKGGRGGGEEGRRERDHLEILNEVQQLFGVLQVVTSREEIVHVDVLTTK